MKTNRNYPKVIISKRAYERQKNTQHPWVYDNEIVQAEGKYENGDIVDVFAEKGAYIGSGFVNDNSKIRVRIISRNANDVFDEAFWERRVRYAFAYRETVLPLDENNNCRRLIHGESDGFSGLTLDQYGTVLVSQVLSLGIEERKTDIYNAILKVLHEGSDSKDIYHIFERNDVAIRDLEGMEQGKGWYLGEGQTQPESTEIQIIENGIKYLVDFKNGQKTGFFVDQKMNRRAISNIAKDKTVLDCFTHTGSFGLNAAKGGAKKVVSLDISERAIEQAKKNVALNFDNSQIEFAVADAFDYLETIKKNDFDFIVLDPPAFTKSRKTIHNAYDGYKRINYLAMKALPRGGYLATCSCSHFMSHENFKKMLLDASREAGVELKQIEERQQGPDHPILLNVPETDYLKFFIFQVC